MFICTYNSSWQITMHFWKREFSPFFVALFQAVYMSEFTSADPELSITLTVCVSHNQQF